MLTLEAQLEVQRHNGGILPRHRFGQPEPRRYESLEEPVPTEPDEPGWQWDDSLMTYVRI